MGSKSDFGIALRTDVVTPAEILSIFMEFGSVYASENGETLLLGFDVNWNEGLNNSIKEVYAFLRTLETEQYCFVRVGDGLNDLVSEGSYDSPAFCLGIKRELDFQFTMKSQNL